MKVPSRILLAVLFLLCALCAVLVIVGGNENRGLMQSSLKKNQLLGALTPLTYQILVYQLDEETGIRGYAAAGDPILLEPYTQGVRKYQFSVDKLKKNLIEIQIPDAIVHLQKAMQFHDAWIQGVVRPLLSHRGDKHTVIRNGKRLMDLFRNEIDAIVEELKKAEQQEAEQTESAIDRIDIILGAMAFTILVGGMIFVYRHRLAQERLAVTQAELARESERAERLQSEYRTERRIAQRLQATIARRPLPVIPSLRFSATYVPATEEVKVGGDWYDVFEVSHERVLFVIGDVAGHGIDAAVMMSQTRQLLIAAALQEQDPAGILRYVNDQLINARSPMITAIVGYADGKTCQFIYATAGHPLPVLLEPEKKPRFLPSRGLALGIEPNESYTTQYVQSSPGAMLVLYTDGAIEHSRDILEGEKLLLQAVSDLTSANETEPAQNIHNCIFSNHSVGDDVAILTVGFADF